MRKLFLYFPIFIIGVACLLFLVTDKTMFMTKTAVAQEENSSEESEEDVTYVGKNTQVLKFTSMIELQTYMKEVQEALGVDCKFCHDLAAGFEVDVPELHKDEAREMMRMQQEINEKFFKDSSEKVSCFTCHRGHEHPANDKETWEKQNNPEN